VARDSQEAIGKKLRNRASKIVARDKTQRINGERSSMRLSENESTMNSVNGVESIYFD